MSENACICDFGPPVTPDLHLPDCPVYRQWLGRLPTCGIGYVIEEEHMEGDVRVIDKARLLYASFEYPSLAKGAP